MGEELYQIADELAALKEDFYSLRVEVNEHLFNSTMSRITILELKLSSLAKISLGLVEVLKGFYDPSVIPDELLEAESLARGL